MNRMITIKAKQNTGLWKSPYASDGVGSVDVSEGYVYHVIKVIGTVNDLAQVKLSHGGGIWYIKPAAFERLSRPNDDGLEDGELLFRPERAVAGPPRRSVQIAEATPLCPLEEPQEAQKRPMPPVYFSQLDNGDQSNRTCFSSSCAMLAKWYKPDSIEDDLEYLAIVNRYGDTTQVQAQLDALWSLGLKAEFNKTWSCGGLCREVSGKDARPIVFAILHRGNYKKPTGGGHYALAYGADWSTHEILVHDPYYADYQWIEGKYGSTEPGRSQRWHFECLKHRFSVNGAHDGWVVFIPE